MALGGHNMSLASSVRPNERPLRRLLDMEMEGSVG